MPGFLDTYGVADHRRGRLITRIVLSVLAIAAVGSASYLYFRTWSQEQTLKHFFAALDKQDFQGAYKMWCPTENICKYNPFDKFEQDWGPSTPYSHGSAAKVDNQAVPFEVSRSQSGRRSFADLVLAPAPARSSCDTHRRDKGRTAMWSRQMCRPILASAIADDVVF